MKNVLLIFDDGCPLCRNLAHWVERRSRDDERWEMKAIGWLEFHNQNEQISPKPLKELALLWGDRLIEGQEAWQRLLNVYPDLRTLNWLAKRLGLEKQTAGILRKSGALARRLCVWCPQY